MPTATGNKRGTGIYPNMLRRVAAGVWPILSYYF